MIFSKSDSADCVALNIEPFGKNTSSFGARANALHIFNRKLRPTASSTNYHVTHVFLMRPKVKMLWIYANRVVTFVKNMRFAYLSLVDKPSSLMGVNILSAGSKNPSSVREMLVRLSRIAMPFPASIFGKFPFGIESKFSMRWFIRIFDVRLDLQRVPSRQESHVVFMAEPPTANTVSAIRNRANSAHKSLQDRTVGAHCAIPE